MASPTKLLEQLLRVADRDRETLATIDKYLHGIFPDPYMPRSANDEYKLIAERARLPLCRMVVDTPAQALYVEGYRSGGEVDFDADGRVDGNAAQWDYWQESRMHARQSAIYRGALAYGHSFVLVEKGRDGRPSIKGLSPLRTSALYVNPANDEDPYAVLTIDSVYNGELEIDGSGRMWTDEYVFPVVFGKDGPKLKAGKRHGMKRNPVTRFAAAVDLEGRTVGVIEPLISTQDRINQTLFDLMIVQTFGSFKARTVSGMAPEMEIDPETGNPKLGPDGSPILKPIELSVARLLMSEDPETKFGTLDHTPLDGYIASLSQGVQQFSAISQTPPHHMLGQIVNLSADALIAAETALARKVLEFRGLFGEAWGRVFRLCAELMGDEEGASNYRGEVLWRDTEQRALSQTADALGKFAEMLDIPKRGLWNRVPGVTPTELDEWRQLWTEDNPELTIMQTGDRTRRRHLPISDVAEAESAETERTLA